MLSGELCLQGFLITYIVEPIADKFEDLVNTCFCQSFCLFHESVLEYYCSELIYIHLEINSDVVLEQAVKEQEKFTLDKLSIPLPRDEFHDLVS